MPCLQDGRSIREAFAPNYGNLQRLCIEWEGPIYLTFVVTTEGEVRNVHLLRGIDSCAPPLVAAVEALGPWAPGEVGGKPVATRMYLRYLQVLR